MFYWLDMGLHLPDLQSKFTHLLDMCLCLQRIIVTQVVFLEFGTDIPVLHGFIACCGRCCFSLLRLRQREIVQVGSRKLKVSDASCQGCLFLLTRKSGKAGLFGHPLKR